MKIVITSRKHVCIILTPFNPPPPLLYNKTGVYRVIHYFLISAQHIYCGYSLDVEAVLTSTHNICVEQKYKKYQNFLSESFPFLVIKFSVYLKRHVFVMRQLIMNRVIRICTVCLDTCLICRPERVDIVSKHPVKLLLLKSLSFSSRRCLAFQHTSSDKYQGCVQ